MFLTKASNFLIPCTYNIFLLGLISHTSDVFSNFVFLWLIFTTLQTCMFLTHGSILVDISIHLYLNFEKVI